MNRLESASSPEGESSYEYNGLSYRIADIVRCGNDPAVRTEYTLDLMKPYKNLIERKVNGNSEAFIWDGTLLTAKGQTNYECISDDMGSPYRLLGESADYGSSNGAAVYGATAYESSRGSVAYRSAANGSSHGSVAYGSAVYGYDEFGNMTCGTRELQPFGYTGYMRDPVADMDYAQAREYMPEYGRFAGQDTVKGITPVTGTLNAYIYCGSMPFRYYDPDGMIWHVVIGAAVGALVSGVTEFGSQVWDQVKSGEGVDLTKINYGKVGAAALGGGITGGLTAAGVPGPVAAGIGGFAEGTLKSRAEGKDWGTSLKNGAISGATSAAFAGIAEGAKKLKIGEKIANLDLRDKLIPGWLQGKQWFSDLSNASDGIKLIGDTYKNRLYYTRKFGGGWPGWDTVAMGIVSGFGNKIGDKLMPREWLKKLDKGKDIVKGMLKCYLDA